MLLSLCLFFEAGFLAEGFGGWRAGLGWVEFRKGGCLRPVQTSEPLFTSRVSSVAIRSGEVDCEREGGQMIQVHRVQSGARNISLHAPCEP